MKSRLYMETSIVSYLTARPTLEPVMAGHQLSTRDWWEKRRAKFENINNAATEEAIKSVCERQGFQCPVICSPEELMQI